MGCDDQTQFFMCFAQDTLNGAFVPVASAAGQVQTARPWDIRARVAQDHGQMIPKEQRQLGPDEMGIGDIGFLCHPASI